MKSKESNEHCCSLICRNVTYMFVTFCIYIFKLPR